MSSFSDFLLTSAAHCHLTTLPRNELWILILWRLLIHEEETITWTCDMDMDTDVSQIESMSFDLKDQWLVIWPPGKLWSSGDFVVIYCHVWYVLKTTDFYIPEYTCESIATGPKESLSSCYGHSEEK